MQCVLEKTSAVTEYTSQWKCKFSWSVIGWGWLGGVRVDRPYLHCSTVCHLGLCALLNAVQILTIFCPTPSRILNLGPVLPQMLELGKIHTHTVMSCPDYPWICSPPASPSQISEVMDLHFQAWSSPAFVTGGGGGLFMSFCFVSWGVYFGNEVVTIIMTGY